MPQENGVKSSQVWRPQTRTGHRSGLGSEVSQQRMSAPEVTPQARMWSGLMSRPS